MTGITHTTALWYASRATGVVTMLLLTAVVLLGILVNRQGRLPGLPGFAVTGLHRNVSLLAVAFLAIHVLTAIADPYVTIGLAAAVLPFASAYKPLWLGLGAISLDLLAAAGRDRLLAEVAAAGLTGRGGAAFPVARKLAAAAQARPAPVVAGNGAEGEPASSKDRSLLWISPHLVLDGLQLAAVAAGSRAAVLYVQRNERLHARLAGAIAERAAAGIDAARVDLVPAPDRFLAGEESALASRLTGRPALPSYRPARGLPRLAPGRSALVQNVAEVPLGTGIAGLLGLDAGPGRPAGAGGAVPSAAGPVQAVLVGGYHGTWLPAATAAGLPLANAALRPLGAAAGAGVLAALPADRCGLAETARVARYLALESAGQCGPCFNGLPRIAAALEHLAGPRPDHRARADLERWAGLVTGRGACHHPDGSVRFVGSALRVFAAEAGRSEQGRCGGTDPRPFLPVPAGRPASEEDWS